MKKTQMSNTIAVKNAFGRVRADLHSVTGWYEVADIDKMACRAPQQFGNVVERAVNIALDALIAHRDDGTSAFKSYETFLTNIAGNFLGFMKLVHVVVDVHGKLSSPSYAHLAVVEGWGRWIRQQHSSTSLELWADIDDPVPWPTINTEAFRIYASLLCEFGVSANVAELRPGEYLGDDAFRPRWITSDEWDTMLRAEIKQLNLAITGTIQYRATPSACPQPSGT